MATAPAPNPFQQFVSGLFSSLSGPKKASTATSTYTGPYAPGYSPSATTKATTTPKAPDPRIGANASYVNVGDAINSKSEAAGIPYIPANKEGYGGMSLVPNQTSVATGKSSSTVPGAVNPKADPGYVNPLTSTPKTSSSKTSTGSTSAGFAAAAAPAPAPAAAPVGSSSGFSYSSSPSTGTFGGAQSSGPSFRSAYVDMLKKLYSDDDLEEAQGALSKLQKQTADAELFSREEERRIRKNEQGQGYKTFAGDLRENTRKSTAELADLAIASKPFEDYITNAMASAKEMYNVGRDEVTDSRQLAADDLAERKFQEDVRQFGLRYALDKAQENRLGRDAGKPTKQDYVGQFVAAFTPGQVMADGTPTVDQNGYITPKAFQEAAAEAAQYGITRKEFIELFGAQLYRDKDGVPDKSYGLTNVEKKLVSGLAPE